MNCRMFSSDPDLSPLLTGNTTHSSRGHQKCLPSLPSVPLEENQPQLRNTGPQESCGLRPGQQHQTCVQLASLKHTHHPREMGTSATVTLKTQTPCHSSHPLSLCCLETHHSRFSKGKCIVKVHSRQYSYHPSLSQMFYTPRGESIDGLEGLRECGQKLLSVRKVNFILF